MHSRWKMHARVMLDKVIIPKHHGIWANRFLFSPQRDRVLPGLYHNASPSEIPHLGGRKQPSEAAKLPADSEIPFNRYFLFSGNRIFWADNDPMTNRTTSSRDSCKLRASSLTRCAS